jgi:hypothetical protein
MKVPKIKFDSLHGISNEVRTVQPMVAVRYTNLSTMIMRMTTSNSSIMVTALVLGRPDESPQVKIRFPSRRQMYSLYFSIPRLRSLPHRASKYIWQFERCPDYCYNFV